MRALVVALALLAGCAAPEPAPAPLEVPPALALVTCAQTHVLFTFPMEAFADTLPSGWSFASADPAGRTATLELTTSDCGRANASGSVEVPRYAEMWGELLVVPPEGATPEATDRWPLGLAVTDPAIVAAYATLGFSDLVAQGEIGIFPAPFGGDPTVVVTLARTAEEEFFVRGTEKIEPAAYAAGARRVWIPAEGGVAGSLRVAWTEGEQVGYGSGVLQYDGPLLNALPLSPGLEHRVGGVNVTVAVWE